MRVRNGRIVVVLGVSMTLAGCGSTGGPRPATAPGPATTASASATDRELSALLLLMADRRLHEPYTASRALEGDARRRTELAVALGRSLDLRARMVLEELTLDPDPEVATEAAFGLGLLGDPRGRSALLRCAGSCNEVAAIESIRSLARLGATLDEVIGSLDDLDETKRRRRLLPALSAFEGPLVPAAASVGTGDPDAGLRRASAAAIAARPSAEGAAVARRLLADADPETRRWAILALEPGATRADLERLAEPARDPEPRVVIAALSTAAAIVRSGRAGATDEWRSKILEHMASPRTDIRLAAIAAADAFLRDSALSAALDARADQGSPWERHLAVRALALGGDDRAPTMVMVDRGAESPITRASAAEVAGILGLTGVVENLRLDPHPRVRAAAWRVTLTRLARQGREQNVADRDRLLREVLADRDLGVREAALDLLCAAPIAPIELLAPVLEAARGDRALPLRLAAVRAIGCRGATERLERGGAILALEKVFADSDHPTRREVTAVLAGLDEEAPAALGSREISWGPERYREILDLGMVAARALRVSTDRGSFLIELECATVPLSCHFVRQLAGQGFYENTLVSSLEVGRALVFGDPRGDGRGGAGFRVADEPDRRAIERGMVGLVAAAGPDTAGGPLFIALAPLPELAGKRAVIGRVVQGLDVVESLVPGDRIQRVELVTSKLSP